MYILYAEAQNGSAGSKVELLAYENLAQQKTNMRAALGRMVDVDIAEESTKLLPLTMFCHRPRPR